MSGMDNDKIKDIIARYDKKLAEQVPGDIMDYDSAEGGEFSKEYTIFKQEMLRKTLTRYETWCNWAEGIIKITPKEEDRAKIEEAIEWTHLEMSPQGAASFAAIVGFTLVLLGLLIGGGTFALYSFGLMDSAIISVPVILILVGVFIINPLTKYPLRLADQWRLEASNQMVMCILYMVMYMRHTSNLEHALKFSGEHVGFPLALDLRKILWDVEIQKFSTVQESLANYLVQWKGYNLSFIESVHLIESSLYEGSEERRLSLLEKALEVMLEGTYENMLHYTHDVQAPITMLHMLGVILPVLGLIILPLMGTLLGVKWYHLALIYNVLLPLGVYYYGTQILSKRPTGYGTADITKGPEYQHLRLIQIGNNYVDPKGIAYMIAIVFCLIGLLPLILGFIDPIGFDIKITDNFSLLELKEINGTYYGPFGMIPALFSMMIPLGIALGMGFYYKSVSKRLKKIRDQSLELEQEFSGSLFQLGNRVEEGIPVERAFETVAINMEGTTTGEFFSTVNHNLRKLGMDVKNAIFDPRKGAVLLFPSGLIDSSMRVLVETARKGPKVVARAMISISNYVKKIHEVSERLKDLLAEILSSMNSQVKFMSPVISGVVVGIGVMITTIIGMLAKNIGAATGGGGSAPIIGNLDAQGLMGMFPPEKMMLPFFFQLVVGIYLIQVIYILTIMSNGIENGVDNLNKEYMLGNNLYRSTILYVIVSALFTVGFSLLASVVSSTIG